MMTDATTPRACPSHPECTAGLAATLRRRFHDDVRDGVITDAEFQFGRGYPEGYLNGGTAGFSSTDQHIAE